MMCLRKWGSGVIEKLRAVPIGIVALGSTCYEVGGAVHVAAGVNLMTSLMERRALPFCVPLCITVGGVSFLLLGAWISKGELRCYLKMGFSPRDIVRAQGVEAKRVVICFGFGVLCLGVGWCGAAEMMDGPLQQQQPRTSECTGADGPLACESGRGGRELSADRPGGPRQFGGPR